MNVKLIKNITNEHRTYLYTLVQLINTHFHLFPGENVITIDNDIVLNIIGINYESDYDWNIDDLKKFITEILNRNSYYTDINPDGYSEQMALNDMKSVYLQLKRNITNRYI